MPTTEPTDSTPGWVKPTVIVVGGLIIVGTIVEDFLTGGFGILDDGPSFAAAGALFGLAF